MKITVLLRTIPSWCIGVLGAFLIILSTVVGTLMLDKLDENSQNIIEKRNQLQDVSDRIVETHIVTNTLLIASGQFFGLSRLADLLPSLPPDAFTPVKNSLSEQAAFFALDAMHTKLEGARSYREKNDIEIDRKLTENLANELKLGSVKAYEEIRSFMSEETKRAAAAIATIRSETNKLKMQLVNYESQYRYYQNLQIALNLLGLAMVLLKDLPIWRSRTTV